MFTPAGREQKPEQMNWAGFDLILKIESNRTQLKNI